MSTDERHGRPVRRTAVVLAVLLVLAGAAALVVGLSSQVHAPQPPASAARTTSAPQAVVPAAPSSTGTPAPPSGPRLQPGAVPPLPAAAPTHLDVPAIGVSSDLL